MKISPMASSQTTVGAINAGDPNQSPQGLRPRTLKMSTNATPGSQGVDNNLSTPTTIEGEATEATQPLSPQYAALAKERRALQQQRKAFEAEKKALEGQSATQADVIERAKLKSDPIGVLLAEGFTFDQLATAVTDYTGSGAATSQALEAKLKAMEEGFEKKLTDRDARAKQQALSEMNREALQLAGEGDDFEMVRETRSVPKVMQLIERTYDETGEVLDVREALTLVENELAKDALRLAQLKKVQGQLTPQPPPQPQKQPMRTLTNRDTAVPPMSRKQRALAAALGQLK